MRAFVVFLCVVVVVGACALSGASAKKTTKKTVGKIPAKVQPKAQPKVEPKVEKKPSPTGDRTLVLFYTASARGQIRSCNCTKFRFGGYGRQLTYLKNARLTSPDTIMIEGGDISGGNGFQARLKAGVAAQALDKLSYGAMVPGEEELGAAGLRTMNLFEDKPTPLVCANLFAKDSKEPEYKPYITLTTTGGMKVGVIGLIDKSVGGALLEKTSGESITDPIEAAKKQVAAVRKKCDLVVAVYHGSEVSAKELTAVSGIDLVLCTHRADKENLFPGKESNTVTAPVETCGSTYLIKGSTNRNWNIGRLDIAIGRDGKIKSVGHKLIYLDRSFTEDPQMVSVYDVYNKDVAAAVLKESSKLREQAETILIKRGVNLDEARKRLRGSAIATSKACADCHKDICDSWAKTRHAKAMASLKSTKQEYDPECVGCHVTGMVVRNGFINYKETPELANVQCEACHGPAVAHVKSPEEGFGKVDEQTCRSCHTDERDPEFDYAERWAKIKH